MQHEPAEYQLFVYNLQNTIRLKITAFELQIKVFQLFLWNICVWTINILLETSCEMSIAMYEVSDNYFVHFIDFEMKNLVFQNWKYTHSSYFSWILLPISSLNSPNWLEKLETCQRKWVKSNFDFPLFHLWNGVLSLSLKFHLNHDTYY